MTDPARAPTIAQLPLGSSWSGATATLAAGLLGCDADYVLPTPPDVRLSPQSLAAMAAAAAAEPDADAFRLKVEGLVRDPSWRGRRCRSHERNLESLRFAHIIAPGGLLVRRTALSAALDGLDHATADGWRTLCRRIARAGRIADLNVTIRRRAPMQGEPPCPSFANLPQVTARVLVLGQIEVSASLYFDVLESLTDVSVAFRPLTRLALDAPVLASADLVILVRELHRFWDEGVIAFLDEAGVPYVYFTDDNFLALRAEGDAPTFYTLPRVQAAMAKAAAFWTSSEALAAARVWLHPKVDVWKPALDPMLDQAAAAPSDALTIAMPGGDFRLPGLSGAPLDALRGIADRRPLRLLVTEAGSLALRASAPAAEIVVQPQERSFRQHIRAWRRFSPDILLHPAGATANAPFKSPTAAIVAGYLGAVPVVADEPAYQGWGEAEGVLRLGAGAEGLMLAAQRARDAEWRADMGRRLSDGLAARFGAEGRARRLAGLMRPTPRRNAVAVAENIMESPEFARQQTLRRLIYIARPLSDRLRPPG
jgi:hypothetical protein